MAIPTFAPQGDTTILRDHQFQDRLLQVWPVISGVAVGDGNGLLIAVVDVRSVERKDDGVEMIKAQINPCSGTHLQGQRMEQQVAAIGVGLIKRAAKLKAV